VLTDGPALINVGSSTYFDGVDGRYEAVAPTISYPMTLECWCNIDTLPALFGTGLVSTHENSGTYDGFIVGLSPTGQFFAEVANGQTSATNDNRSGFIADPVAELGVDYHVIVAALNKSTVVFYINGVAASWQSSGLIYTAGTLGTSNGVLVIGERISNPTSPPGAESFHGHIDQVALYNTELPSARAQAHYDAAGINVVDSSEANVKVTRIGQLTYDTDMYMSGPSSLRFNGVGAYARLTNSMLSPTGNFTLEGWVNKEESLSAQLIYAQYDPSPVSGRLLFSIRSDNTVQLFIGGTPDLTVATTTTIDNGKWTHIAATREEDTFKIFVSGVLSAAGISSLSVYQRPDTFLGRSVPDFQTEGFPHNYKGVIDDFKITKGVARYTQDFTPETFPSATPPTDYIAKWNFNEASGTTAIDETGNFNGTYTSTALRGTGFNGTGLVGNGIDSVNLGVANNLLSITGEYTFVAWVYWASSSTIHILDLSYKSGSDDFRNGGLALSITALGEVQSRVRQNMGEGYNGSLRGGYKMNEPLVAKTWTLIVVRRNNTSANFTTKSISKTVSEDVDLGGSYPLNIWESRANRIGIIGTSEDDNLVSTPLPTGDKLDGIEAYNRMISDAELSSIWNGGRGHQG
jgi:hypothetical protein